MDDRPQRDADDSSDRPPSADGVEIDLIGPSASEPGSQRSLMRVLAPPVERIAALLTEQGVRGEARVKLVHDDEMARNHEQHKGVSGTTDVLTFDLTDDADTLDADILVCVDEAQRQAEARGHAVEHEIMLYLVHGLLHCLGHNDTTPDAANAMHRREDELLTAIGLGPVFARPEAGS